MQREILDWEVSEEKNIRKWPRDLSGAILAKNVAAFSPFHKNLPVAKLDHFVLMTLAEEVSKQPNTDCVIWLLVIILINKRSKLEKEKHKMHVLEKGHQRMQ